LDPDPYWSPASTSGSGSGKNEYGSETLKKNSTGITDPDPGASAFLTPGSGMGKKSGSGMNSPDHNYEGLETIFWVKILNALMRIRDPGWKKTSVADP
jgi:hypothetical protein